jgi:hypothetical protein
MANPRKFVRTIDSESEMILSTDYYLHKAIMQAIESPFKSLENNSFENGLVSVKLAAFLTEKLSVAAKILNDEDLKKLEEHKKKVIEELVSQGEERNSQTVRTMVAYSTIAWILSLYEEVKPTSTSYELG